MGGEGREMGGDGGNGADVVGDVVAAAAVAAGEGADQAAALVGERQGDAVDFGFGAQGGAVGVGRGRRVGEEARGGRGGVFGGGGQAQGLGGAVVPGAEFVLVVGVVDRQHRHGMRDGDEVVDGGAADPPGGRVGGLQVRVGFFELLQLAQEGVEFGVAQLGGVAGVVQRVVPGEFAAQKSGALNGLGAGVGGHAAEFIAPGGASSRATWLGR